MCANKDKYITTLEIIYFYIQCINHNFFFYNNTIFHEYNLCQWQDGYFSNQLIQLFYWAIIMYKEFLKEKKNTTALNSNLSLQTLSSFKT